jgi:hypothetical protein
MSKRAKYFSPGKLTYYKDESMRHYLYVLGVLMLCTVAFAYGQEANQSSQVEALRSELQSLHKQLDSLKNAGSSLQQDDLDALEDRLDKKMTELENKIDAVSRSTAPIAFNPRMVAFVNFAARADNKPVYDLADPTNDISNKPFLRTVELELSAPVDPYASAVTVISVENEAGKDFAIDAEEAYGLITRLPIIESSPLGMRMKLGKYRANLGTVNKIHMHDLPWTTRPLMVTKFMGTEHGDFFEAGFNPTGVECYFYLPNPIPGTTLEMSLDAVRAGDIIISHHTGIVQPAYIGHINLSKDWENEHLLNLGLSAYDEGGNYPARLYGADITYKWAPSEERESNSVVAGGEVFVADRRDTVNPDLAVHPSGGFGYFQYQTSYWLYLGARFDWVQEPIIEKPITKSVGAYASYYTTEFLRFRIGFEHRWSEIPTQDNVNTGLLDVNFVFGSHPTEPYWVNR